MPSSALLRRNNGLQALEVLGPQSREHPRPIEGIISSPYCNGGHSFYFLHHPNHGKYHYCKNLLMFCVMKVEAMLITRIYLGTVLRLFRCI